MKRADLVALLTPSYERQYQDGVPRRVEVVWRRCVDGQRYREIGQAVGVTPTRARQLYEETVVRICRAIGRRRGSDPTLIPRLRAELPQALVVAIFGSSEA